MRRGLKGWQVELITIWCGGIGGEGTSVAFRKGTVPFSSNESGDRPPRVRCHEPDPSLVIMAGGHKLGGWAGW